MTVTPPPRSRPPVVVAPPPRARSRPQPVASPPPRSRPAVGDKEHWVAAGVARGFYKEAGYADPRLPVPVVMDPRYRAAIRPDTKAVVEEYGKVRAGDNKHAIPAYAAPAFIHEWALRNILGWALMDDECYAELEQHVVDNWDQLNTTQKSIGHVVDGRVVLDMSKSVGPFYLEGVLQIEHHYRDRLRKVA